MCHPALFDPIDRLEERKGNGEFPKLEEEKGVAFPYIPYRR
jgi:hypothetical protein